jgi:hypothetical protein
VLLVETSVLLPATDVRGIRLSLYLVQMYACNF